MRDQTKVHSLKVHASSGLSQEVMRKENRTEEEQGWRDFLWSLVFLALGIALFLGSAIYLK